MYFFYLRCNFKIKILCSNDTHTHSTVKNITLFDFVSSVYLFAVKSDCIKPFNQTGYITAKVRCDYPREEYKSLEMFFCKDNNSICEAILPSQFHQKWTFTNNSQGFNKSISNVSLQDEGVYWCRVKFYIETSGQTFVFYCFLWVLVALQH